jgi:hypothetical protein
LSVSILECGNNKQEDRSHACSVGPSITMKTVERAKRIVTKAGGSVTVVDMVIPLQEPKPPGLEQWDMGIPSARIDTLESAWTWRGRWVEEHYWNGNGISARKMAHEVGAEATLNFTGSAVSLAGAIRRKAEERKSISIAKGHAKSTLILSNAPATMTSGMLMS